MSGETSGETSDSLVVLAGNPTADELAAVTAVLTTMAEERTSDRGRPLPGGTHDAWERSGRALRAPLYPGLGAWRRSAHVMG